MEYSEEEISLAFEYFVTEAQRIVNEYLDANFSTLPKQNICVKEGSVYWRLFRVDDPDDPASRRLGADPHIHAFVRKKDGAIFRPASWKAPQTKGKSAIRAYVTDEWAPSVLTPHGVCYVQ